MKKLLIVESPAKIKTIKKFLGPEFTIMSTVGHIKDLPPSSMGVTRNPITLEYVAIENKEKVIADLKKAAKRADEVYLAPDPDREGEIIGWHAAEEIKQVMKDPSKIYRVSFNEITKPAVNEAIDNPRGIDLEKVAAQQARRVLDRWVGYEVSPILWRKISKGLSAGRVQSVALKLICDREAEIRAFNPEEYWSVTGTFKNEAGELLAALSHVNKKKIEIKSKEQADTIVKEVKASSFSVEKIEDKKRLKNPVAPFMTSTLQQASYNRLGYSVKKTMEVAQRLYEGLPLGSDSPIALITYMRTDSLRLSETALTQGRKFIKDAYGDKYLSKTVNVYEKKGKSKAATQDAHEAVRPVDVTRTPDFVRQFVTPEQAKVYEMIWQRFVACQMTPAQYAQRQVTLQGGKYTFKATGSTLIFDGFLKAYNTEADEQDDEKEENRKIPAGLKEKQAITATKIDPKQHFTQAPPRYSEASLVKELEKEGIGRPSTYATIMNTIRARDYTTVEKKRFMPTELGMAVTKMLTENLPHIVDKKFTAHMEEDLDKVSEGELDRDVLLNGFYDQFEKDLKAFKGSDARAAEPTEVDCPTCKEQKLLIRFGKSGQFLGCAGYPECPFTSNFARDTETNVIELVEKEKPKELDEKCPQCSKPMREMVGKYGKFISCSGYPDCKYIQQNKAGFKCPKDGGDVVERAWRGGKFWGCGNYPKCKFALFGEIVETPCPKCDLPALITKTSAKTGVTVLSCSDKKCGYKK